MVIQPIRCRDPQRSDRMSKLIPIQVNGQQVSCDFGVNWFYKHYHDVTGKDMLEGNGLEGVGTYKTFDVAAALFYAGHKAHASATKTTELITLEAITDYVMALDLKEAIALIKLYTDTLPKAEPGEAESQAAAP